LKLAAMQPYFFPYLGYFQLISAADLFIAYDKVNYIVKGWINRNRIIHQEGIIYFGVPTIDASSYKKIEDIIIKYDSGIRKKMLKVLYLNYKNSSFFDETYTVIERALSCESHTISELNKFSILTLIKHLDVQTEIITDSSMFVEIEERLKSANTTVESVNEKIPDKKTQRVIWLCEKFGSNQYINPIGGEKIYSRNLFDLHGISLNFLKTLPYSYTQRNNRFIQDLSIIDVLMNCGREETKKLLDNYVFV
jgi:WbqC-like protein family